MTAWCLGYTQFWVWCPGSLATHEKAAIESKIKALKIDKRRFKSA
jgi:hypothetical protein